MKKITLSMGLLALILLGTASLSPMIVSAYQGDPTVKSPNYSADRHAAMENAFKNNDFDAWKNLMTDKGRVTQIINKDNFSKFAEAHVLAAQGKTVEALKILRDLGLGLKNGSNCALRNGGEKNGGGMGFGRGMNR